MKRDNLKLVAELSYGEEGFEEELRGLCIEALKRIAFGTVNDGLKLMQFSDSSLYEQAQELDLFAVREFQLRETNDKRKLLSIKFYDRFAALSALIGLLEGRAEKSGNFLELCKAITGDKKNATDKKKREKA